ncbi:twin-arginine translocase subunit TatC [Chloroflexus aggregans]|uniref:Sec-independent protein translocase protein TatC n=1 Tax=Chloroflexus aggregans (strain MD-66 / DSM 9485) TaxID=326427 RepID=B8GCV8_CHLAD|nr:twin-arginine translocase subunit TatC [Chloroflexus aggregans]ACL23158.1 Sec-independent protein translocase, TatC subunit [Chloroflexus aggregans DSM 9485]
MTTKPARTDEAGEASMTLIEHLIELRSRIIKAGIGVLIGMVVGFIAVWPQGPIKLIDILILTFAPVNERFAPIQSVGTTEQFTSYMKVALLVGVILAMPVIVYQLLAFIIPGLTASEKRLIFRALPFVTFFFLAGIAFGWFVTTPVAIRFLIGFSDSPLIQTQPTLSDFLETVSMLLLINGIVFELPIIIYVLAYLNVTTAKQLAGYRRYALVIVVIIAAFITPTGDPVNLILLALPMYLLYEVGIILARFVPHQTQTRRV